MNVMTLGVKLRVAAVIIIRGYVLAVMMGVTNVIFI
jgi:hypothetical protein